MAKVEYAAYFEHAAKRLKKKYPHISADLHPLVDQLEQGETPGDQVPGVRHPVYKVRLRNTDAARGKSGGYRVIYYLKLQDQIVLLTIYTKSEHSDIPIHLIQQIIDEL